MSIDIEMKIDDVLKQFKTELKTSKVVDEAGNVNDKKAFAKLVDQSIKRLTDLESHIASEAGVVTDRYGAEILYANIQSLKDMKQAGSLSPSATSESLRRGAENEEDFLKSKKFFGGIFNLFKRNKTPRSSGRDDR